MSNVKEGCFYTKEHEWISFEENVMTLGVSDYAQNSLGDIVFVELPELDVVVTKDESFGVVESVKAVSDLYSPISGTVVEVNEPLNDAPEIINSDPYEEGWIIRVELGDSSGVLIQNLKGERMSPDAYNLFLEEEEE